MNVNAVGPRRIVDTGNDSIPGDWRRAAAILVLCLLALKIGLLLFLALNTRFVMDEFGQLGFAKYLSNGFFNTVWPAKAVGYAVFYKVAHLIGWDAASVLLIGRLQTALLALGTLAIIYGCARALGEDRLRALLILLVLLSFSNFMERIFRTRAEPLAVFFAAAALLVILRGQADRARTIVAAGILSGLSFLATQKAVYFNVALGLALVADAALAKRFAAGVARGAWLIAGWLVPVAAYCFIFGGAEPLAVARHLVFGPVEVATQAAAVYGGLRQYVVQTLARNILLHLFCFAGLILAWSRVRKLDEQRRIALVFTTVITGLVFVHDQPWPYVFVMALPFLSLWSLAVFQSWRGNTGKVRLAWAVLAAAIGVSFVKNALYLRHDNRDQLELVARAESLIAPDETYFDGVGMLPNRPEPTTLWLDRMYVLRTLREGPNSEAYRVFAETPPKIVLWSYRMDAIEPVVGPLIRDSYVRVAPNVRMAGRRLALGRTVDFDVPRAGTYALYNAAGARLDGRVEIDGALVEPPLELRPGPTKVALRAGAAEALLLPEGSYHGRFAGGGDYEQLFGGVYD